MVISAPSTVMTADQFGDAIAPHLGDGFRLAKVMLGDRQAAEDAVQEAALKAWRGIRRLRGGHDALRPWFLSIVANECRMERRRRWWSVLRLADPQGATSDEGESEISDLRAAISALPRDQQVPLLLFFYLDLSIEEMARVLGVSAAAARSRLYRAVARLRPLLDPREVLP